MIYHKEEGYMTDGKSKMQLILPTKEDQVKHIHKSI